MNASPAYVCCQVLSSTHLEQIRSWWGQLAIQVTGPRISLSERDIPPQTGEIYQLLLSPDLQALLLASPQAHNFQYEVRISFEANTIKNFLQGLAVKSLHHPKIEQGYQILNLPPSINVSSFQNKILVKILSIISSPAADGGCSRIFSVCQPIEAALSQQIQQERLLNQVITQMRQSLELPVILETVVREAREFLQVDRLLIYQFFPDTSEGKGKITSESRISDQINSVLNLTPEDDCFSYIPQYKEKYRQGLILAVDDVDVNYSSSFCLSEFLRQHQVRSKLIAPIVVQEELWGLLIAHQCGEKRRWLPQEKKFLGQIGEHLAIAIYQAQLYSQVQEQKDIFECRVIERTQELQDTLMAAEAANLCKSEFLNNMSHELLTPLTCIIGLSSTLQKCSAANNFLPPDKQKHYLQVIQDNGNKLLELINDLLNFSQVSAGKAVLDIKQFSLKYLCNHVLEIIKTEAEIKGINLILEIQITEKDHYFYADYDRVQQILLYLLKNALKFTPEQGAVTLRLWKEGSQVIFQVEDTGIGIPAQKIPLLFEKFTQLDGSRKRRYGGMGLGLALTKQLVELHRGTIEVESCLDKGSIFTVRLPQQKPPKSQRQPSDNNPHFNHHHPTVVLIESDEEIANLICELLMVAHYQVIWLIDSVSAIKKIEIVQPSIIIVDRKMPDIYHLCHLLKKSSQTQASKVLILNDTPEISVNFLGRHGIDDYLLKPIQPSLLLEKIRYLTAL
ncbi:MAG: GAF domain-containing protein [Microcystis panniformis Mp_MB_F_20051200_S9]|uniref:histidine kinase n=1 Tax=Microcystis panniformis Mp_MB_F_20051200_S9 TaxID=2486223 RepID=A0A552Q5Z4_9CHRO|nr:MAG: GAF domain-containing protein [Microcystis panniformis Mp_MB_F_20080800_S26D]TRV50233.1 MAG: GAF domain-containing protein [Microcystis panniformis Mp_GB_SS_20050300_S99]TRV54357.1 MAG: GAF domain-containing protein [Microcystis panniformis Mp_GB_SS_20050300_S99D]TRV62082.1 MAG: GAF domain-containing protein [Microcystis panniformis Mp_MB_F_20051200_S9D]TRV63221.1 MAG: GAF domain-containing protein [Microcystis panniformis Mp_MB_F_20080800_S26]TRV64637.1 MAG: GAF domain-containing prot